MLFVCAKEGKYVAKIENNGVVEENEETEEDGKGIPRKRARGCSTVKCGCKAHLLIKYDKWSSKWKVTVFTDAHNHPLVTPSKRMRMKSNRHMPKAVKNLTKAFHKENLGIFKVTSIFGGEHIGFDNRDCYNHLRNVRNVFNKFNDEMSGVFHYKVEEVGNANGIQSFIVKSKEHEVKKFEVPLDLQTYMESTKLACLAAPSNEAYMIYIEAMNDLSKKLLKVPKNTPNLNLIVLDPILMI
ncbi:hypothetical protein RHGRI_007884 [Rhododendron griersonianum]|uniref:FAR1 domain-containing protein n=1 Tax=Rhododendron griersonianum TaxID=479676 RepID=A0AAV6KZD4_9ERIC|nr:hypothetical protein RHGRI_007884 [Rhododendron griersonianum]